MELQPHELRLRFFFQVREQTEVHMLTDLTLVSEDGENFSSFEDWLNAHGFDYGKVFWHASSYEDAGYQMSRVCEVLDQLRGVGPNSSLGWAFYFLSKLPCVVTAEDANHMVRLMHESKVVNPSIFLDRQAKLVALAKNLGIDPADVSIEVDQDLGNYYATISVQRHEGHPSVLPTNVLSFFTKLAPVTHSRCEQIPGKQFVRLIRSYLLERIQRLEL